MNLGLGIGMGFGGAPPAFSPLVLADLGAWYDAAIVTLTSSKVSAWPDQSLNGDANRNLAQATAANRPGYTASNAHFNGAPTVNVASASTTSLASGTWSSPIAATSTWYAVVSWLPNLTFLWDGIDGTNEQYCVTGDPAANDLTCGTGTGDMATPAFSPAPSLTNPKVLCVQYSHTAGAIFANDHANALVTGMPAAATPAGLILGNVHSLAYPADADIAALLIFQTTHNAATRLQVMQYLGAKYGIAVT